MNDLLDNHEDILREQLIKINFRLIARETYYAPDGSVSGEILRFGYYVGNCPLVVSVNMKTCAISLAAQNGNQGEILVANSTSLFDNMIVSEEPMFISILMEWFNQWKKQTQMVKAN